MSVETMCIQVVCGYMLDCGRRRHKLVDSDIAADQRGDHCSYGKKHGGKGKYVDFTHVGLPERVEAWPQLIKGRLGAGAGAGCDADHKRSEFGK